MACCSGESPARWCWRKGGRSRQPPGKGGRPADSRGVGVPGGLLEHPCGASLLLSQPPLGVSPLPRRMRWSGKEAALSNSHWRQPEAPQSPLLPPPPPDPGLLSPCISGTLSPVPRPGGSRGVAAQSCTPQLDLTVRLVSGGCWGADLCPSWVQRKLWVFLLHWWGGMWPRLCHTGVFLHPIVAPQRSCSGGNAVGTRPWLRLSCKSPSSLSQPR